MNKVNGSFFVQIEKHDLPCRTQMEYNWIGGFVGAHTQHAHTTWHCLMGIALQNERFCGIANLNFGFILRKRSALLSLCHSLSHSHPLSPSRSFLFCLSRSLFLSFSISTFLIDTLLSHFVILWCAMSTPIRSSHCLPNTIFSGTKTGIRRIQSGCLGRWRHSAWPQLEGKHGKWTTKKKLISNTFSFFYSPSSYNRSEYTLSHGRWPLPGAVLFASSMLSCKWQYNPAAFRSPLHVFGSTLWEYVRFCWFDRSHTIRQCSMLTLCHFSAMSKYGQRSKVSAHVLICTQLP